MENNSDLEFKCD